MLMHSADTVGVWRIILVMRLVLMLVLNYVRALKLTSLVYGQHTPFHSNAAAMQAFV